MKQETRLMIAAIVIVLLTIGCGGKEEIKKEESKIRKNEIVNLSAESIKQIKLETETITLKPITGYLTIPAKVITNQDNEAQIGSLVQGRVHRVFIKVGDFVKAGQILMDVEGLEIGEIKAGYLKAKANYEFAKADLNRHKILLDQNIGSKQSYYEVESEYQKAYAEFQAEDKKIHSIGLSDEDASGKSENKDDDHTSGKLAVRSPINGIVVERNIVIGQLVDATTNAFKVINTNNVWIDGQIYEKDLTKINGKTEAVFTSSSYTNEKFNGRIIYIGQTVDERTRTITVRGEFANSSNKLKPQMFGELKLPVSAIAKAILIPGEALVNEGDQNYLFVQTSDSTFEKRNVITGLTIDNRVEIKEGLKEGDKIVSRGVFYLRGELKKDELEGD
jgi:membrane fusion protein, heavy metal efflux system